MKTKIIAIAVVGLLVVGGGLFYASTKFLGNDERPNPSQMGPQGGQMRGGQATTTGEMMGRSGAMDGRTVGEIVAKDDASITIKTPDGSSRVVLISSSTSVNKMTAGSTTTGSITDLVVGENVMVVGATNADGNINAESIQLIGAFQRPTGGQPPSMPVR